MLNKVILMGRLTRDPELKHTQSNISVSTFSIAVDRGYARAGEERQTDFIDIVTWRNTAEFVTRYFRKGQMIAVSGRLQTRKWQDNQGNNRTTYEVVADEVFFADSKKDNTGYESSYQSQGNSSSYTRSAPAAGEPPRMEQPKPATSAYDAYSDDDELPF